MEKFATGGIISPVSVCEPLLQGESYVTAKLSTLTEQTIGRDWARAPEGLDTSKYLVLNGLVYCRVVRISGEGSSTIVYHPIPLDKFSLAEIPK